MERVRAYLAYGIQVPAERLTDLGQELRQLNRQHGISVSCLEAGRYDDDDLFLVTETFQAEVGESMVVGPDSFGVQDFRKWDRELGIALRGLGIDADDAGGVTLQDVSIRPGWLLIADND